jgi:hypothetical protein
MATFGEAFSVLDDYRLALLESQHAEAAGPGAVPFAARGAFSAFSTPLTNVHATGVGVRRRGGRVIEGDFVIKVYVFDKQALGAATPAVTRGDFKGVGIDVEHLPVQQALARSGTKVRALAGTTPSQHQERRRPAIGGVQISPVGANFVGTLGCLVRRDSALFVLSNNHVLADTNRLPLGTQIVQPVGSIVTDVFARLNDFEEIRFPAPGGPAPRNRMDAAIAAVTTQNLVDDGTILGVPGYTPELLAARPAMPVTKSGRTTGVTTGRITAIRVNGVTVNYGTPQNPVIATFDNCVEIVGEPKQSFSGPGDSGSVILEAESGKPVALLFAGDGTTTTACDLTAVCTRFNVVPA